MPEPTWPRPFAYDRGQCRWRPGGHPSTPRSPRDTVRVISWNVWFGELKRYPRAAALLAEIMASEADVVALQEVRPEWLAWLLAQPDVRDRYVVSDATGETLGDYGVVLLSRLPIADLFLLPLPSSMDRAMLAASLEVAGRELVVATVHAESTKHNAARRREQFGVMLEALRALPSDTLLVGDTNLGPDESIDDLLGEFIDLWPALHPGAPGITRDPVINVMRESMHPGTTPARLDRMLLRAPKCGPRPVTMALLGTAPIPGEAHVFPSDHFGLLASFAFGGVSGGSLRGP